MTLKIPPALGVTLQTDAVSAVACPWPYPQAKTWDPRGYYESQGAPGPFTAGAASTWQIGQPAKLPMLQHERHTGVIG